MLVTLDFKKRNATYLGVIIAGITLSAIFYNNPLMLAIIIATKIYLLTGDRVTTVYATVVTLPRDFKAFIKFAKLNFYLILWDWKKMTVSKLFDKVAKKYKYKTAFIMDEKRFTFHDVNELSNQIGSLFKSKNYKKDDTIALLMENCPEYPCIWLGLSKIGCVTALINTNLRKDTLLHSIKVANSKAIIVSDELSSALKDIQNDESIKNLQIYQYHEKYAGNKITLLDGAIDLVDELKNHQGADLSSDIAKTKPSDKMVYIYTSGTTGLPKAAVITNMRFILMGSGGNMMLGINEDDIIYNSLPLYHTAGGMLGLGNVLLFGITMVIRKKFSASNFWTDCIKYECTIAQYIGEICRYLLSSPIKPTDKQHKIRMMFGNGLRQQIWQQFITRFNIEQIGEIYGSTEGNSNLINFDNQIGAIGFVPLVANYVYPVTLIKCDEDSGEPIRDKNGRCIKCAPGEPGVLIGQINSKRAYTAFNGYADRKASEKKILKDVFREGDFFFNSGDILVKDILGYYYFKDRTGDTYRWRGENVATSEVEAVISNVIGLKDCVVYGVEIPHVEGRAGMAAILDPDKKVDMEQLSISIRGSLPPYARPLFIRLLKELPITGTFKLKKRDLQLENYNLDKIKNDPIYYLNSDGIYREFTRDNYDDILNGRARL